MPSKTKRIVLAYTFLMAGIFISGGMFSLEGASNQESKVDFVSLGFWVFGNLFVLGLILDGKLHLAPGEENTKYAKNNPVWFWSLVLCIFIPCNMLAYR